MASDYGNDREGYMLTRGDVESATDIAEINRWILHSQEMAADIKVRLESLSDACIPSDDDRVNKALGALIANKMIISWGTRRIVALGGELDAGIRDKRGLEIQRLNRALEDYRKAIRAIDPSHPILLPRAEREQVAA